MAKRRKRSGLNFPNPFFLGLDMFDAGMQMANMLASSGKVIAHRSDMAVRALNGELPLHHTEFTTMWLEKFLAGSESLAAAMKYAANPHTTSAIRGMMHTMTPYSKRASANAKRLGKRPK